MKLGNNTISKVLRGSTQIQKVFRGTALIWENWVLQTGNKWLMTSNNTPSPFVVDSNDYFALGADHSGAWKAFDDLRGASQFVMFNSSSQWAYAWIDVVNAVRPVTFLLDIQDVSGDDWGVVIEGSNDMVNWDGLYSSRYRTTSINEQVASVSSATAYRYFRIGVHLDYGSTSTLYIHRFLLQSWYQKG